MPRELTRRRRPTTDETKYTADDPETTPADDTEEDDKPARGRGRGRVHAEEEKPARGRGRSSRAADEDDEDEKPSRPQVRKGWAGLSKVKSESSDFAEELKLETDNEVLIHFLDFEPFATWSQHWVERQGKKSWECIGEGCPLCDMVGDRPSALAAFNVVLLPEDGDPEVKMWVVRSKVATQLENLSKAPKSSPLNRADLYFGVTRSGGGKKGPATTSIVPVKERDLAEDWQTTPLTDEELDGLEAKCYDESEIRYPSKQALRDIAEELLDD
jgi:hypothetical protein